MEYLVVLIVIAGIVWFALDEKFRANQIKRNGIKVRGIIVANKEFTGAYKDDDPFQLGGLINEPTVKFITKEGKVIIGSPEIGFVSQHKIVPPVKVIVIYDPKQPEKFCIDFD